MQTSKIAPNAPGLDRAIEGMAATGAGVWEAVLNSEELEQAHRLTWEAAHTERAFNGAPGYDLDDRNVRVMDLISVDPAVRDLAFLPAHIGLVERFLGAAPLLSNYNANITGPGSGSMHVHADQGFALEPWPEEMLAINCIWALDDFTEAVGATRFVPGSHLQRRRPATSDPTAHETVPVECPAGSMILLDGRTWHTSGANRTTDRHRIALFAYYVRSWIRPQVNWDAALAPEVVAALSPEERAWLGLGPVGNVDNLMGL